jgi:pyrroline-5-carboxylate reductase
MGFVGWGKMGNALINKYIDKRERKRIVGK